MHTQASHASSAKINVLIPAYHIIMDVFLLGETPAHGAACHNGSRAGESQVCDRVGEGLPRMVAPNMHLLTLPPHGCMIAGRVSRRRVPHSRWSIKRAKKKYERTPHRSPHSELGYHCVIPY